MKLSWTAVCVGTWEDGDGKKREGEKHLDCQSEKGSTSEIMYLRVSR